MNRIILLLNVTVLVVNFALAWSAQDSRHTLAQAFSDAAFVSRLTTKIIRSCR